MSEWLPIESAPKDGNFILIWLPDPWHRIDMCRWSDEWGGWVEEVDPLCDIHLEGCCGANVPSHWMPLPQPPKE